VHELLAECVDQQKRVLAHGARPRVWLRTSWCDAVEKKPAQIYEPRWTKYWKKVLPVTAL